MQRAFTSRLPQIPPEPGARPLCNHHVSDASAGSVMAAIGDGRTEAELPDFADFDAYTANGGYQLLGECQPGAGPSS